MKIANVYARSKNSMSPVQLKPRKEYINHSMILNENQMSNMKQIQQDRYHSVSNSISSIKLPSLNNKSIALNSGEQMNGDLSSIDIYNPYENRQSHIQISQKLLKKG